MGSTAPQPRCSFCGKGADEVRHIVMGVDVAICDGCIRNAADAVEQPIPDERPDHTS